MLKQLPVNPLTPMGNQNIISPHNINTKPSRQVMGIHQTYIQNKILQRYKKLSKTIRKITNEILGVKTFYG